MAMSVHITEPRLRARMADGSLTGVWLLDPARSTVRLRSRGMWGLAPVKGVFTVTVLGDDAVQLAADVRIDRFDFGLTWNRMGMAARNSTITVNAVFVRH